MSWVNLNDLYATKSELATKVPTSRTINGKALSSNVTLAASDIKLSDSTTLQSAWDSISPDVVWQGNTSNSLTLTIPDLKARRFIYVKLDRANDFIQIPTYDMVKTEFSTICTKAVDTVYRIIDIHVFATVDGNEITLSDYGYNTYDSNGLGQALVLTAGYYANITEVYC